jgi:hypothetical protein
VQGPEFKPGTAKDETEQQQKSLIMWTSQESKQTDQKFYGRDMNKSSGWEYSLVVEHLPSMYKVLDLILSTATGKQKWKKK